MSYRQGQIDALLKLGFIKSSAVLAPVLGGAALGATVGGLGGYYAAPHQVKGTGAATGAVAGGLLGALGGGILGADDVNRGIQRASQETAIDQARALEGVSNLLDDVQKMDDAAKVDPLQGLPKTPEELQRRLERAALEKAKKKPN